MRENCRTVTIQLKCLIDNLNIRSNQCWSNVCILYKILLFALNMNFKPKFYVQPQIFNNGFPLYSACHMQK